MKRSKAVFNDRGMALVLVLWVMTVLIVLITEFAYSMKVETHAVRNFRDEAKARSIAKAGLSLALAEIMKGYSMVYLDGNRQLVFARKDGGFFMSEKPERELEFGGGSVAYTITDEAGKLNINNASRDEIASLLKNTGVTGAERDIITDSVMDWRDEGHEFRLNGAEDDYYLALPEPYEAKDGPLDTIEELLLVKGVTPGVFYGKENLPPEFSDSEDEEAEDDLKGISQYVTVKGDGRININTASETVLEAIFGKGKAQEIMARRNTEGYYELQVYGGKVTSNIFEIESRGRYGKIEFSIKAIVEYDSAKKGIKTSYWKEGISG